MYDKNKNKLFREGFAFQFADFISYLECRNENYGHSLWVEKM